MNQTDPKDVFIVGGGPAGSYCAYELARKGISATILDHSHPREKPCGGGISYDVIKKFPFMVEFSSKGRASHLKIILSKDKQVVTTEPIKGFNISRRYLDGAILKMAIQNGARLEKEKVIEVRKRREFWQIKTNKSVFSAKILVGADGVNSIVRRKTLGAIARENLALTYGYFVSGAVDGYSSIKYLDEIPGYIWVLPRDNHTSVGIGSELKYGNLLKKLLDDFIRSYYPQIHIKSQYAAMLPSAKEPGFFMLPCAGPNWVLVGDAAGHTDPITGGGILYALWSGRLAAEAISKNDPELYDCLWRKEYGNKLMKRCMKKTEFYDPVRIPSLILRGLADNNYKWYKR